MSSRRVEIILDDVARPPRVPAESRMRAERHDPPCAARPPVRREDLVNDRPKVDPSRVAGMPRRASSPAPREGRRRARAASLEQFGALESREVIGSLLIGLAAPLVAAAAAPGVGEGGGRVEPRGGPSPAVDGAPGRPTPPPGLPTEGPRLAARPATSPVVPSRGGDAAGNLARSTGRPGAKATRPVPVPPQPQAGGGPAGEGVSGPGGPKAPAPSIPFARAASEADPAPPLVPDGSDVGTSAGGATTWSVSPSGVVPGTSGGDPAVVGGSAPAAEGPSPSVTYPVTSLALAAAERIDDADGGRLLVRGSLDVGVPSGVGVEVRVDLFEAAASGGVSGADRFLGSTTVVEEGSEAGPTAFRAAVAADVAAGGTVYAVASGTQVAPSAPSIGAAVVDVTGGDLDGDGVPESIEGLAATDPGGVASPDPDGGTILEADGGTGLDPGRGTASGPGGTISEPGGGSSQDAETVLGGADVAAVPAMVPGAPLVGLDAGGYTLRAVRGIEAPAGAAPGQLPFGLFGFEVHGVQPGGSATVRMAFPGQGAAGTDPEDCGCGGGGGGDGVELDGYYKLDPDTGSMERFDFDGSTGAVVEGDVVTLHLVDGGRGDADGVANGVIVDPGGPGGGVCRTSVDVVMVLDGSGSIDATNFGLMKDFANQFVAKFAVSNRDARFGFVQFASEGLGRVESGLSGDAAAITSAISGITQIVGSTDIQEGLALARAELANHGRIDTPSAIILLTDGGHNNPGDPIAESDGIKQQGTEIFGIAIGQNLTLPPINAMASDPDSSHVFAVSDFNSLVASVDQISETTCHETTELGSVSGSAYLDGPAVGARGPGDPGIPGVSIILEGTDSHGGAVRRTTSTGSEGGYSFGQLPPGTYSLSEVQPAGYLDGVEAVDGSKYTEVGTWGTSGLGGFSGDSRFSRPTDPASTATWSFGVTPGRTYRVSATWIANVNRATNAPFTALDGAAPLGSRALNQQAAPDDLTASGVGWEDIGTFAVAGPTLLVRLANVGANNLVTADAIRVEDVTPRVTLTRDDGDAGYAEVGTWGTSGLGGFSGDSRFSRPTDPASTATWSFGVTPGRTYRVSATWIANVNRATNAPFTALDGAAPLGSRALNQQAAPDDLTASGVGWEDIGTFAVAGPTLLVRLTNVGANNLVAADAIRVEDVTPPNPSTLDDGDVKGFVGNDRFTSITLGSGMRLAGYDFGEHTAPAFSTSPVAEVKAGAAYAYDTDAADRERDPIAYSLVAGPAGMSVNAASGLVSWNPTTADVGNHSVVIRAGDGRGGVVDQPYTLTVLNGFPNRPPRFTSDPVVDAQVGVPYSYQAAAFDPDGDVPLTFDLMSGPAGLAVTPAGLVSWTPGPDQLGQKTVTLRVSDNRAALPNAGGTDTQTFTILVGASPGNGPPTIVSTPATTYRPTAQPSTMTLYGKVRDFKVEHPDFQQGIMTLVKTGMVATTLGADRTPTFVGADHYGGVRNASSFREWYHDTRFVNRATFVPLTMTYDNGSGFYVSDNPSFFPIDNQLFGNEGYNNNLHFTMELHASFTYRAALATKMMEMRSDDDSWLFIDGQLVIDLGGLHSQDTKSSKDLGTLGLVDGRTYSLDLFFAEREMSESKLWFQSSFPLTQGRPYLYDVEAIDPDNDPLTYQLLGTPPAGMSIDPQTGVILWDPTPAQVGLSYPISVRVSDGRGGSDTQDYTLNVVSSTPNVAPVFQTTPTTRVLLGDPYSYRARATDADGDRVTYVLLNAPAGMGLNANTGELFWQTLPTTQVGPTSVSLYATDGRGGSSPPQNFDVTVTRFANGSPSIIPVPPPPPTATEGQEYTYQVIATDPEGDPLEYDLVVHPAGMQVHSTTGRIAWTPTGDQVGAALDVVIRVRDVLGASGLYAYQVTVADSTNHAPLIVTTPPYPGLVGKPYRYQLAARDPDPIDTTFTYSPATPLPTGMSLSAAGLIQWTPGTKGNYRISVRVTDPRLADSVQSFVLRVDPNPGNSNPAITSTPRKTIRRGDLYLYKIAASDADFDALVPTVTLPAAATAAGMTFDAATWTIKWPAVGATGSYGPIQISVTDNIGIPATQSYTLVVDAQDSNQEPRVTSAPWLAATYGKMYSYDATALDPDGDPVEWALDAGPDGMVVDPTRGAVRWTPRVDQLGPRPVTLRVRDPKGGWSTQSFTVAARGADLPPRITSTPSTRTKPQATYNYTVVATDPDDLERDLIYTLAQGPAWLDIDHKTHVISGAVPVMTTPQSIPVQVQVDDGRGGISTQIFTVVVEASPNLPPRITSTPPYRAIAGSTYNYAVAATDPEGGTITYSKLSPTPAWLSINATNGALQGTVPGGTASYTVVVKATDPGGAWSEQTFTLSARSNQAPSVAAIAAANVTAGTSYRQDVVGSDLDGDPLTYEFAMAPPSGMAIDSANGRITWDPGPAQAGIQFPISVRAKDPFGATSNTVTYNLTVQADTQLPTVAVEFSVNPAPIGSQVRFLVTGQDNVGVVGLTLTVAGQAIVLDGHGAATVTMGTNVGPVTVVATARDAANNTSTPAQPSFSLFDPTDTSAPVVTIAAPAADATLTTPANVIGTVSDPQLTSWTLDLAPIRDGSFTVLATNSSGITNGTLGLLDPTRFANGPYILRLTAIDSGGHTASTQRVVNIDGNLKLGNLKLSFTDLTIPVAGIPLTVTRSYDTLRAKDYGEVGYGWRLEFGDLDVKVSLPDASLGSFGDEVPFRDGTKVTLTGPDGTPQRFTFQAVPSSGAFGIVTGYRPYFVPDADVTSRLTVPAVELLKVNNEYISLDAGGIPYNPADPAFGGSYTLTTQDGLGHTVDAESGRLLALADRNKNTLRFRDDGIVSDTGRAIVFGRDVQGRITTLTDPRGHSVTYGYNTVGDLVSVTDREGRMTQLAYNAARPHYLETVFDPLGRTSAQVAYNTEGRVGTITDAAGKTVTNAYTITTSAWSQTVTDQNVKSSVLTFDALGNVTKVVDAAAKTTKQTYVGKRLATETRVIGLDDGSSSETNDLTTSYDYDAAGNIKAITDPAGGKTRLTYDDFGQPRTVTAPDGQTTTSTYDPTTGNLLSQSDPAGNGTSYSHDTRGNVTRVVSGLDADHYYWGDPAAQPNVATTTMEYDQYGQVEESTDARGTTRHFDYDENGNAKASGWTWVDPINPSNTKPVSQTTTYDNEDRPTVASGPTGTTQTEYDALGRAWRTTDNLNGQTTTTFDARGLAVQVQTPDGRIARTVYDAKGRAIYADDPHLPTQPAAGTQTIYDDLDRVTSTRRYATMVIDLQTAAGVSSTTFNPANSSPTSSSTSSSVYDDAGRVIKSTTPLTATTGHDVNYEYDKAGRQTAMSDVVGGVTRRTEYGYDAAGRQVLIRDALLHETRTVYDESGRAIRTIFADNSYTTAAYDRQGRRVAATDALDRTTNYEYDSLGHLTAVVLPEVAYDFPNGGFPVELDSYSRARPLYEYTYDDYGNLIQVKDPLLHATQYAYDELGRKVKTTLPMGQSETWRYDALGRLDRHVDYTGKVEKLAYDPLGRLATDSYHDTEAGPALITYAYTYDAYATTDGVRRDRVVESRPSAADLTTDRYTDREGRLVKVVSPEGTVNYEYDPATGRKARTYTVTGGTTKTDVGYQYDEAGRLWKVNAARLNGTALGTALTTTYEYNLVDQPTATTQPNGTKETRAYDALNRPYSVVTKRTSDGVTLASFTYTLDPAGRRVAVDELGGRRVEYTYDELGRLTQELVKLNGATDRTLKHRYDKASNRTTRSDSYYAQYNYYYFQVTTYTYNANDFLLQENFGMSWIATYINDAAGRVQSMTSSGGPPGSGGSMNYTWDVAGRLTGVQVTGTYIHPSETAVPSNNLYTYNAGGIRVSQTVDGVRTNYLIDETEAYDQVLEEYSSGGALQATYVRGLDLLFQDRSGTRSYFAKDGLGSTRALTSPAAAVTDTYAYEAYGSLRPSDRTGTTANPYQFAGEAADRNTGQVYLRARYYADIAGRFASRDTYDGEPSYPITQNHYIYAGADPVNNVDPSGHEYSLGGLTASIGIGGLVNGIATSYAGGSFWKGFAHGAFAGAVGYLSFGYFSPLFAAETSVKGFYLAAFTSGAVSGGLTGAVQSPGWNGNQFDIVAYDVLEGAILGGAFGLGSAAICRAFMGAYVYLSMRSYGKGLIAAMGSGPEGPGDATAIFKAAQEAWTKLPVDTRKMMHAINEGSRPLSDFKSLPMEHQKIVLDYFMATGKQGGKNASMSVFNLNKARIEYATGLRSTPPGGISNFESTVE